MSEHDATPPKIKLFSRDVIETTVDPSPEFLGAIALLRWANSDDPGPPPTATSVMMPESPTSATTDGACDPAPKPEVPGALAVDILLKDDVRNVKVQLEELLHDLNLERSDAVRYVRLARAKALYERAFPEAAHGKRSKDPKSGSLRRPLAFVDYAAKKLGWSRASIGDWASTGERLTQATFEELLGTKLANRPGALRQLRELAAREQFLVARGFRVGLERDAVTMLNAYYAKFKERKAREAAQTGGPPPPVYADDNNIVVPVSAEGVECTLHGHLLRVSVEGNQVRVRYLAHTVRPRALAAEGWIHAVENAAKALRGEGYEVAVSPVESICEHERVERHEIRLRAWKEASVSVVAITRKAMQFHPPLYTADTQNNLRLVTGPVVMVARPNDPPERPPPEGGPWSIDRARLAFLVETAIRRLVLHMPQHDDGMSKKPAPAMLAARGTADERATSEATSPAVVLTCGPPPS